MNSLRLRHFVQQMTLTVEREGGSSEAALLDRGQALMLDLITHDDWLPDVFAKPHPDKYQQYLLYCDPFERFQRPGLGQHSLLRRQHWRGKAACVRRCGRWR